MPAYHQLGHDSWNLVDELSGYAGVILSPVNDTPREVAARLTALRKGSHRAYDVILDPQFYQPASERGQLGTWPHFTNDVDTANLQDETWWDLRGEALVDVAREIGANAVCTPAMCARQFDNSYYTWTVDCATRLLPKAGDMSILLTAVVRLSDVAQKGRAETIASILTSVDIRRCYLVFYDDLTPRTQRTDLDVLRGAGRLIRLLEAAGTRVLIAFSGLDMIVWKGFGASDVATGKYFNLRRFLPSRWEETADEGRVVPYWTDAEFITWFREVDVKLLDSYRLLNRELAQSNPHARLILERIDAGEGEAWVGLAWRQYMYWFEEIERAISRDAQEAVRILERADAAWGRLQSAKPKVLLFDRQNTGEWIRPWLNALATVDHG